MKPSLLLNMIVRNESERIERCLASAAPYIKAMAITDTGSTDDTVDRIVSFCGKHGIPLSIQHAEFVNFSQARNEAFANARRAVDSARVPFCQFALLMDADMELVVADKLAFGDLDASAPSYDLMQKAGKVSYANRRLLNLSYRAPPYVGVTHEYIDVPTSGMIKGAHFVDHADGSNRKDKYERDAALLTEDLKLDPDNARSWYYLGNTYRDWGKPHEATDAYEHRIMLGGWDEETHSAMMNLAGCLKDADHADGFVAKMIAAYNFRPRRAEPLYDLAKYYREKGDNAAALLFAKEGLEIRRPDDMLFVNDFVYEHGLKYEFSIAGFYSERDKQKAYEVTNALALDPTCPDPFRWSARNNLYFYTEPLSAFCPSFRAAQIGFSPPRGYTAMNPSVVCHNGKLLCNVRCVNYKINEHGQYMIGELGCGDAPIDTRNYICPIENTSLAVRLSPAEVIWQRPDPAFPLVTGLEDIRLYTSDDELWFSSCVRELSSYGTCQQVRGRLDLRYLKSDDRRPSYYVDGYVVMSDDERHEKNWMPMPHDGQHDFMYRANTVWHATPETSANPNRVSTVHNTGVYTDNLSGSSQMVRRTYGWISVLHEAIIGPDSKRMYWHRFAMFSKNGTMFCLSRPFVFFDRQIEFCAGLAAHPNGDDFVISFGVRDAEAWLATVSIDEVEHMMSK